LDSHYTGNDKRQLSARSWLLILAFSLAAVLPRTFFLDSPLNRDEGAYATVADCIARGGIPYVSAFDHKPPAIYYIYYAAFSVFGHTAVAPRLAALLAIWSGCLLLPVLVYRITKSFPGALASSLFLGWASVLPATAGASANTEVFAIPFIISGVSFLVDADRSSLVKGLFSGLAWGTGIILKQPVAIIGLFVWVWSTWSMRHDWRKVGCMSVGCAFGTFLPLSVVVSQYLSGNRPTEFIECFYAYNYDYSGLVSWSQVFSNGLAGVLDVYHEDPIIWFVGISGLSLLTIACDSGRARYLGLLWFSGSFIAVALGGMFYTHYFVFVLPVLSFGGGLCIASIVRCGNGGRLSTGILCGAYLIFYIPIFKLSPRGMCDAIYPVMDRFPRAEALGKYMYNIGHGGSLFIVGSEPELYFYAEMVPVSRFIYQYPLYFPHRNLEKFRKEVGAELQAHPPEWLVIDTGFADLRAGSWERKLLERLPAYDLTAVNTAGTTYILTEQRDFNGRELLDVAALLVFKRSRVASVGSPLLADMIKAVR